MGDTLGEKAYLKSKENSERIAEIENMGGVPGVGVVTGGTTGQVLSKKSNTDYDTEFITLTKSNFGLENIDNTSDLNKPISTPQQLGLDTKLNKTDVHLNTNTKDVIEAINENFNISTAIMESTIQMLTDLNTKQNKTDNTLQTTSKDIVGAINENFTNVNNYLISKANIIDGVAPNSLTGSYEKMVTLQENMYNNLTAKGVSTNQSKNLTDLSNDILNISAGTPMETVTKLNVVAPYTKNIILDNARELINLCTSCLEYVFSSGIVQYNCDFNNGDSSNFTYDANYLLFDGVMHCKTSYINNMVDRGILGVGKLYDLSIDKTIFNQISSLIYTGATAPTLPTITATATPLAQVTKANSDINLTGVETLDSIVWTPVTAGTGKALLVISVDGGITYKAHNGTNWITVDPTNKTDFLTNGMSSTVANALTKSQLEALRNGSIKLRFAYLLSQPISTDVASDDKIQIKVSLIGTNQICATTKYTLTYNESTKTLTYTFNTSGTYTINYVD